MPGRATDAVAFLWDNAWFLQFVTMLFYKTFFVEVMKVNWSSTADAPGPHSYKIFEVWDLEEPVH